MIIDRIEDGIAVVERDDGSHFSLPAEELPDGAGEGSVIAEKDGVLRVDLEAEKIRKKEMLELQNKIFGRGGKK